MVTAIEPRLTQRSFGSSRSGATRYRTARAPAKTASSSPQRTTWARTVPTPPSGRASSTIGTTATSPKVISTNTIAPSVSSSEVTFSLKKFRVSTSS